MTTDAGSGLPTTPPRHSTICTIACLILGLAAFSPRIKQMLIVIAYFTVPFGAPAIKNSI